MERAICRRLSLVCVLAIVAGCLILGPALENAAE